MCTALEASLADGSTAAEAAESALSQHKATATKLLQQCVSVLGIAPEQLFPGLVQRLQDEMKEAYEDRLKTAERKAVMAQVLLTAEVCLMSLSLLVSMHRIVL